VDRRDVKMRVETDVRAGNIVNDAGAQVNKFGGQAADFVSNANQQAEGLTTTVVNKSTKLWNCLTSTFS